MIGSFLEVLTSTGYFSYSASLSVTSSRFSTLIGLGWESNPKLGFLFAKNKIPWSPQEYCMLTILNRACKNGFKYPMPREKMIYNNQF